MYKFSRETKKNTKTGESYFVDHFEMASGERRLLPNGVVQEDVKAGHVEASMLKDKDFGAAYKAFCESFNKPVEKKEVKKHEK